MKPEPTARAEHHFSWHLARRAERMNPSVIREILKLTERPGIISLAGGLPSPDSFPVEAMREATARVLRDNPREALQYAASEGFAPLREWVAAHMRAQGMAVDAAQVLITTGSQQGLDLVGKVLIDAGSTLAVESPTYLGALQAFAPYEPEVLTVPCDDDGPLPETMMDLLEAQERYAEALQDVKLVIVLSTMLHGIGVGNMLPSWVRMVCAVDIAFLLIFFIAITSDNPGALSASSDAKLHAIQVLGLAGALGTLLVFLAFVRSWRDQHAWFWAKVWNLLVLLACIGFVWFSYHWNLLNFNMNY